jgi:hypothetical protein
MRSLNVWQLRKMSQKNLEIEPILSSPDSRDTDEVNVQCYKGTFSWRVVPYFM